MNDQPNEISQTTFKRPETVQDLISLLKTFPLDHPISFAPFNLQSVIDKDGRVQFEMCELEGTHYEMKPNLNG